MKRRLRLLALFATVVAAEGCGGGSPDGSGDAGAADGGSADGGRRDAGVLDADAGAGSKDASVDADTCAPGATESRRCGRCGDREQTRTCAPTGAWGPFGDCPHDGACDFRAFFPPDRFVTFDIPGWHYELVPWRAADGTPKGTKVCHLSAPSGALEDIWFIRTDLDTTPGDVREESDWYPGSGTVTWTPPVFWGDAEVTEGSMVFEEHVFGTERAWTSTLVERLDATLTVPAGEFEGVAVVFITQCFVEMDRRWDHRFYFAPGVGFIRVEAWSDGAPCDATPALVSELDAVAVGAREVETPCEPL